MREILFRGQTRKYGEKVRMSDSRKLPGHWVYGGVLQGVGSHSIIYSSENVNNPGENFDKWCVHTDTLGQFTGLTDKNGKKIFEGDIVKVDEKHYEVKFVLGQFFIGINMPIAYKRFDCEIIGNIHDNPEMLKGGEG